ncbi:hypothetical protein PLICRDRAFT_71310, partial [Plicaturopsis crispa FD-325 SS-3]
QYWAATNPPPNLHVQLHPEYIQRFVDAYQTDAFFKERWRDGSSSDEGWHASRRYFKDAQGLLFFRDADFRPRLCIPTSERASILREAHESAFETAHAG